MSFVASLHPAVSHQGPSTAPRHTSSLDPIFLSAPLRMTDCYCVNFLSIRLEAILGPDGFGGVAATIIDEGARLGRIFCEATNGCEIENRRGILGLQGKKREARQIYL